MDGQATVTAKTIDQDLAAWLSGLKGDGKPIGYVHSVFQRVINFVSIDNEQLFSIGNPSVIMSPSMLRIGYNGDFRSMIEQKNHSIPICLLKHKLSVGENLEVLLEEAEGWDGSIRRFSPMEPGSLLPILHELTDVIDQGGQGGGFKEIWLSQMKGESRSFSGLHERELSKRFGRLQVFTKNKEWNKAYEAAKELAGLGLGLTPSGDDFLAGWLLSLHSFDHPLMDVFSENKNDWLRFLKARTTAVSFYMLEKALHGKGNDAIKQLIFTIHLNHALVRPTAIRVLSIGSCSGTDMLAGVGFALTMESEMQRR